jgi:hypothetical protein
MDLFLCNNALNITVYQRSKYLADLARGGSSISSCGPWSLITKISIDEGTFVNAAEFESILQLDYNILTLEIHDYKGVLYLITVPKKELIPLYRFLSSFHHFTNNIYFL